MMHKKRTGALILGLVLIVLIVLLLFFWPGRKQPAGPPLVIELVVTAGDELEVAVELEESDLLAHEVLLTVDQPPQVVLGERVKEALRAAQGDSSLVVEEGLNDPREVTAIVIERIEYDGQGRSGARKRVRLCKELPPGAGGRSAPAAITFGVDDNPLAIYDVVAWGEVTWSLTPQGQLEVRSGGQALTLSPGQGGDLPPQAAKVPVKISEYGLMSSDDQSDLPPIVQRDLGAVAFTSKPRIRFLGRCPLKEAQP